MQENFIRYLPEIKQIFRPRGMVDGCGWCFFKKKENYRSGLDSGRVIFAESFEMLKSLTRIAFNC